MDQTEPGGWRNLATLTRPVLARVIPAIIFALFSLPSEAQQYSVSFSYRVEINVSTQLYLAGVKITGVEFVPFTGTPNGRAYFFVRTVGVCGLRLFGTGPFGPVLIYDTGPAVMDGPSTMWADNVSRGYLHGFAIVGLNCYGQPVGQDLVEFWTPPPQIVTLQQWEQVTITRRTVRVGYN